ncbi:adenylosuccinate synthetase, partial [bacterium]|nr:adenylosuccinate synthetase [bacterium]
CTDYEYEGKKLSEMPCETNILRNCKPVYEILDGWMESTKDIKDSRKIPANMKRYLDRISELIDVKIKYLSTGEDRNSVIRLSDS